MLLKKEISVNELDRVLYYEIIFIKNERQYGKEIQFQNVGNEIVVRYYLNGFRHGKTIFSDRDNNMNDFKNRWDGRIYVRSVNTHLYYLNGAAFMEYKNKNIWGLKLFHAIELINKMKI